MAVAAVSEKREAFEVAVVGESLVDRIVKDGGVEEHAGGSPLNVAYGLAKLGIRTTLQTEFADDWLGGVIAAHLAGVPLDVVRHEPSSGHTASATASIDVRGVATYSFDIGWDGFRFETAYADVLHVGSIAAFVPPGCAQVRRSVNAIRPGTICTFDPNIRPNLLPDAPYVVPWVEWYAARAHVMKLSEEDARWLHPKDSLADIIAHYLDRGAGIVALTCGEAGSVISTGRSSIRIPAQRVRIVDTIGAGDAYMSGLISVLADGEIRSRVGAGTSSRADLYAMASRATSSAAITVSRAGANPPTGCELEGSESRTSV